MNKIVIRRLAEDVSTSGFTKCILEDDLITPESEQIASGGGHQFPARIRGYKIPFKRSDVACDDDFKVLESTIGKSVEEHLCAVSDFFLASKSPTEMVRADGCVINAIVSKETSNEIGVAAIPCRPKIDRTLQGHFVHGNSHFNKRSFVAPAAQIVTRDTGLHQASLRSVGLCTLPDAVRGSSLINDIFAGHLNEARLARQ